MEEDWRKGKENVGQMISHIFKAGLFTDVTLRVGPKEHLFRAHKLILMTRSPVFAANLERCTEEILWERWIKNDPGNKVKATDNLPEAVYDIDSMASREAFEIFLKYLYTDELSKEIPVPDALDVLDLAHFYQVEGLLYDCLRFFKSIISTDNCVEIYNRVKLYNNEEVKLSQWVFKYLIRNMEAYSSGNQFLLLDEKTLRKMIVRDDLAIEEAKLFKAVLGWSEHGNDIQSSSGDSNPRKKGLESLIQSVRFPLMGLKAFTDEVVPTKLLSDSETIQMFLYFNRGPNENIKFCSKPRNYTPAIVKTLKCYTSDGPWAIFQMLTYSLHLTPELRLRTETRIEIKGLRFYKNPSSSDNSKDVNYNLKFIISVETISGLRTISQVSARVPIDKKDRFDVLLEKPIWLDANVYYWISTEMNPTDNGVVCTPTTKGFAYGSRSVYAFQEERLVTETGDVFHVVWCQEDTERSYINSYIHIKSAIRNWVLNSRTAKKNFYGIVHSIIYSTKPN